MEPNAVITISSLHQLPDGEQTPISLVTQGHYAYAPEQIVLQYAETEMTGQAGVVNTITVEGDTVTLVRTGALRSEMRFAVGQPHEGLYDLGFAALYARVCARNITVLLNERGGILDLEYDLEIEHTDCGSNLFHIEVRKNPAP